MTLASEREVTAEVPAKQRSSLPANYLAETLADNNLLAASSTGETKTPRGLKSVPHNASKPAYSSPPVQLDLPKGATTSTWSVRTQPEQREASADMRPPPVKRQRVHNYDRRPRLSICPSVSPDAELVEDRDRNDNTLKGKFEAIFEKYGRDFTGVGDEINVMTGEVIVDNGHILSMDHETDTGSPSRARPSVYREGMTRSITPIRQNGRSTTIKAENIIANIEAMAQRVVAGQTPYPDEADGKDWYDSGDETQLYQRSGSVSSDSLFGDDYQDWAIQGSIGRDSLLEHEEEDSSIESFHDEHGTFPTKGLTSMRRCKSGSMKESVFFSSGLPAAPASQLSSSITAPSTSYHGHPPREKNQSQRPSPPTFIKSNGKQKIIAKKFNVSKAYEELQRQASTTSAGTLLQQCVGKVVTAKKKQGPARSKAAPKPAKSSSPAQEKQAGAVRYQDETPKRLLVPRISSKPQGLEGEYDSDDPLAF